MKLSYNWLKDYVAVKLPPEKLAHRLTMAGLEVEKIESVNGDSVFELEVTPNRPDCLNVLGLAREVSAILDASLKAPKVEKLRIPSQKIDISVEDKKDCGRYIGTLISDVKVASSARWLEEKLQSIGTRGINNVVDITNFCLMELGQPLHAFDHDKLKGGAIIVRRARSGETIVTIDGVERKLDPSILVIADAQRPVAIAGIMGGRDTEVSERTKNILLESAYFDQVLIRRASRKLGLSSDSSYRFERGVAMQTVETASTRAAELIKKEAGGKVSAQQDVFSKTQKKAAPAIALSLREINDRLGSNLSLAKCKAILNRLGFSVSSSGKDKLRLTAPAFRNDIKENVDIVEEVARIIGYDNLPLSIPRIQVENITIKSNQTHEKKIRGILTALGFDEIITYSMVNQSMLDKTALGHLKGVRVQNPLSQDQEMLRPAVLPSLLSIVLLNLNRGQKDLRLFEIGKVYSCEAEKKMINIVASGSKPGDWRSANKQKVDFYDLKGVIQEILKHAQADVSFPEGGCPTFQEGAGAMIQAGNQSIGVVGKISKEILVNWDIKEGNVFFAQLDFEWFCRHVAGLKKFSALNEFPAIVRDISLAIKRDISFKQVQGLIAGQRIEFLRSVFFVEQYLGDKISPQEKGMTLSLVYQSPSRTLTDEEVSGLHAKVCQALVKEFGARIR